MRYRIIITDEADDDPETPLFSARVDTIDLPAITALVFQPVATPPRPRAVRSDAGKPRKGGGDSNEKRAHHDIVDLSLTR